MTNYIGLEGINVLVVEDEAAIAMLIEDMLLDFNCEVIGPESKVAKAVEAVQKKKIDIAVLDVNIAGDPVYPVAEELLKRNIPIVFSTGYGEAGVREDFRRHPVLQKPFLQDDLFEKIKIALSNFK